MSDSLRRQLERMVSLGDFSVVPALARIYERGGHPLTIWVLLHQGSYGSSVSLHATENGAYREAAKDVLRYAKHPNAHPAFVSALRPLLRKRQWKEAVICYMNEAGTWALRESDPELYIFEEQLGR